MKSIKWIGLCAAALFLLGTIALADPTVVADWTFETSMPATAGPFTAEIGTGSALGFHARNYRVQHAGGQWVRPFV